jgi:hypothetical protein
MLSATAYALSFTRLFRSATSRWQRDKCPEPLSLSNGTVEVHAPDKTLDEYSQRGWKEQPEGKLIRDGGWPGIARKR